MKKTKPVILAVILLAAVGAAYLYLPVFASQPGDASDPLITRSYVDRELDALRYEVDMLRGMLLGATPGAIPPSGDSGSLTQAQIDDLFEIIMLYFETVYGTMLREVIDFAQNPPSQEPITHVFEVINLRQGQSIIFEAGTEFILRSGSATVIAGASGIVDITGGRDITNNQNVSANHLMHVPATDGRGMRITSDAWIMVRGGYSINN